MGKRKRIAFFIPSFNGGGAEKMMIFLSNSFVNKNYKVDLITLSTDGVYKNLIQQNVNIHNLNKSRVLKSIPPLIKYFRKNRPDVFISAMTHVNAISIISKLLSGIGNQCKLVVSIRSITTHTIKSKLTRVKLNFIINKLYRYAQEIVCISNAVAADLIENFNVNKQDITVINNPVIYPDIYKKADELISLKKNPNKITILSVGRLESIKNFSVLIKAAKVLVEKDYPIKVLILGEGSKREELNHLIKELNLQSYVYMPGFKENVYPYYKIADLFVLPSSKEGLGNVLIEAMAFNLPVIAANHSGGPVEILEQGKMGMLFNNDDYKDLSLKIEKTIIKTHGKKVHYDTDRYTLEAVTSKYEKLLNGKVLYD